MDGVKCGTLKFAKGENPKFFRLPELDSFLGFASFSAVLSHPLTKNSSFMLVLHRLFCLHILSNSQFVPLLLMSYIYLFVLRVFYVHLLAHLVSFFFFLAVLGIWCRNWEKHI